MTPVPGTNMEKTAAFLAALFAGCLLPAAGAAPPAGDGFGRGVRLFEEGRYREALLGFMDAVAEDPRDARARQYLRKTGALLLEEEKSGAAREREELLRGAEAARGKLERSDALRRNRLAGWELLAAEVRELASVPGGMEEAVSAYRKFLLKTPVYSDGAPGFSATARAVKAVLYRAVSDNHPGLPGGQKDVDGGDMAAAVFLEGSAGNPRGSGRRSGQSQAILDEMVRIKRLEDRLDDLFGIAGEAFRFHRAGNYREAGPLWRELLEFDSGNEEALLYLGLAAGHAEKAEEKAPPPAARPPAVLRQSAKEKKTPKAAKTAAAPAPVPPATALAAADRLSAAETAAGVQEPAAPAPETEGMAGGLYEKGVREFSVENYAGAVKHWEDCLKLEPGHLKAKMGLERAKREQREKYGPADGREL